MKVSSKSAATQRRESTQEALTVRNQQRMPSRSTSPTTEFGRTLRDLLGNTFQPGKVNEEELFAAAAYQLIFNRYGSAVANDFKSAFKLNMADKPQSERVPSAERAAKESLKFFVKSTLLTREEALQIRQLAMATCQLDDNLDVAWDSIGDTKASTGFANGERLIQGRLEASGNAPVIASKRSRSRTVSASGYATEGAPRGKTSRKSVKRSA
ncbi:MAG: hypothetical protein ACK5GN_06170 [Pseudomonadota bacterium]|jgi:hypothetical protein